jgi:lipopolysaccharide export system protein LptC
MARADFHSRMVGWLKVGLPLAALAILSTLFLLADRIDPNAAIPYAEVDVEDLARDPRMSAPTYAGTTSDGTGITVSAIEARPAADGTNAVADGISALIETPDGARIDIAATRVELDEGAKKIVLEGGVTLMTSTGYAIRTEGLSARLDRTGMESTSPVQVTAPMGQLDAEGFSLQQDANDPSAYLLVFKGGVKLVYQPGQATP